MQITQFAVDSEFLLAKRCNFGEVSTALRFADLGAEGSLLILKPAVV